MKKSIQVLLSWKLHFRPILTPGLCRCIKFTPKNEVLQKSFLAITYSRKGLMVWNLRMIYFIRCALSKLEFFHQIYIVEIFKNIFIITIHTEYLFVDNYFFCKGCNKLKQAKTLPFLLFPIKPVTAAIFRNNVISGNYFFFTMCHSRKSCSQVKPSLSLHRLLVPLKQISEVTYSAGIRR